MEQKYSLLFLSLAILIFSTSVFAANDNNVKFSVYTGSTLEKNHVIFDVFTSEPAEACFYSLDNSSFKIISEKINATKYKLDLKNLTTGNHNIIFSCKINNKNYSTNLFSFKIYPVFCGDGICSPGETPQTCSKDCGSPDREIGYVCYSDDSCKSKHCVHGFCREKEWAPNDTYCDKKLGENCENSPQDCGTCPSIHYQIHSSIQGTQPFCKTGDKTKICVDTTENNVSIFIDGKFFGTSNNTLCFKLTQGNYSFTLKKKEHLSATGTFAIIDCDKKIFFGLLSCKDYGWLFVIFFALISFFVVWLSLNPRYFVPKYRDSEDARDKFQHFINRALRSLSEEEIVDLSKKKGWQTQDVALAIRNVVMQRDFKRFLISSAVFLAIVLIIYLLGICEFYWISLIVFILSILAFLKIKSFEA